MQMCLILVTGFALASSKPIRWCIERIAGIPWDTASAAALVALVAMCAGLFNWGLGLIVGALLASTCAEFLSKRGIRVHYPLICAAGYTGMLTWHGGLSGSAPLKMTKPEEIAGILPPEVVASLGLESVPLQATIFSELNLFVTLGILVLVPVTLFLLAPRKESEIVTADDLDISRTNADEEAEPDGDGPVAIILNCLVACGLLLGMIIYLLYDGGLGRLGPNEVNATMLGLGMLFHGSPKRYLHAVEKSARGCAGIILQFPFYAGIMALLSASGLAVWLAEVTSQNATPMTLPIMTFLSAGLVNFFVPSGGGQWGIQGPIALEAGASVGVPASKMIMSVAYGDELTNMLQPFWAIPLLAITGIRAREIVGYTALVMIVAGSWMIVGLLAF
jgi:short-chain fatty acids transporter